jgi:hypothetical protein
MEYPALRKTEISSCNTNSIQWVTAGLRAVEDMSYAYLVPSIRLCSLLAALVPPADQPSSVSMHPPTLVLGEHLLLDHAVRPS